MFLLSLFCFSYFYSVTISFARMIEQVLLIQVIFRKKENKIAYLRCRKRSISSITSIDQQLSACKVEPRGPKWVGFKMTATFIFPFKAFGNNLKLWSCDELRKLKAPSHCSRTTLSFHGCLLKTFHRSSGLCREGRHALYVLIF